MKVEQSFSNIVGLNTQAMLSNTALGYNKHLQARGNKLSYVTKIPISWLTCGLSVFLW